MKGDAPSSNIPTLPNINRMNGCGEGRDRTCTTRITEWLLPILRSTIKLPPHVGLTYTQLRFKELLAYCPTFKGDVQLGRTGICSGSRTRTYVVWPVTSSGQPSPVPAVFAVFPAVSLDAMWAMHISGYKVLKNPSPRGDSVLYYPCK
jgi:hypothetical protein